MSGVAPLFRAGDMVQNDSMPPAEPLPARDRPADHQVAGTGPSILICRPNTRLGNTLLMTPLLEEIETTLPNARVDVLSGCPAAHEVFQAFPGVKRVHQLPLRGVRHPLRYLLTLLRVRRTRYDVILDPSPNSWTSRFLTRWLAGRLKVGFISPRKRRGVDVGIPFNAAPRHMGAYPVYLLRRALLDFDVDAARADDARLSIRLTDAERTFGKEQLARLIAPGHSGAVVAVATHATGAKRFAPEWWRRMIQGLERRLPGARVIEIRPPGGAASLAELPGYASRRVRQVAAVIEAARCFVCADSGLMHLGAATDTVTVGLFKVTLPALYAPRRGKSCAMTARDDNPDAVAERIAQLLS
jgi:ADP-heptose:LPS heptosyltransferase